MCDLLAGLLLFITAMIFLASCDEDDDEIEAEEQPRHLSHPHRRYLRKKSRRSKL